MHIAANDNQEPWIRSRNSDHPRGLGLVEEHLGPWTLGSEAYAVSTLEFSVQQKKKKKKKERQKKKGTRDWRLHVSRISTTPIFWPIRITHPSPLKTLKCHGQPVPPSPAAIILEEYASYILFTLLNNHHRLHHLCRSCSADFCSSLSTDPKFDFAFILRYLDSSKTNDAASDSRIESSFQLVSDCDCRGDTSCWIQNPATGVFFEPNIRSGTCYAKWLVDWTGARWWSGGHCRHGRLGRFDWTGYLDWHPFCIWICHRCRSSSHDFLFLPIHTAWEDYAGPSGPAG